MEKKSDKLVLIVDDDPHIQDVVRFALAEAGFQTAAARSGREALAAEDRLHPDLVILDIVMPGIDGVEVCKRIRSAGRTPIIFLTSRDDEVDRILGLELGGDDYVTKPFSPRELVLRVKAVLRRGEEGREILSRGRLTLDLDGFEIRFGGEVIPLTSTEHLILRTLLSRPGKVFTRDELLARTHDAIVSFRTIDSHVRRIRRKFRTVQGDPIETVHGIGYRISDCS